jgi:hypothetical protein
VVDWEGEPGCCGVVGGCPSFENGWEDGLACWFLIIMIALWVIDTYAALFYSINFASSVLLVNLRDQSSHPPCSPSPVAAQ